MQFKFDPSEPHQQRAIWSVVKALEGCLTSPADMQIGSRRLRLNEHEVQRAVEEVQNLNGLIVETESNDGFLTFPNLTVEMETGTGKTYTYLRTAFELYKTYGLSKFCIVVPSIAIKEGVLKTFEQTADHFAMLYPDVPYTPYKYDSKRLERVRSFATSPYLTFLILTLDSFNKDRNVLNNTRDQLFGGSPLELINRSGPVLVLDEPQNMESEISRQALERLRPLLGLRYSATHRRYYNLVYRLSPKDAFDAGLVKRVEVAGLTETASPATPYIRLLRVVPGGPTARIEVDTLSKRGGIRRKEITVKGDQNLFKRTGLNAYDGLFIEGLDANDQVLTLSRGIILRGGDSMGADKAVIFAAQIRYTIEEHFKKQRRLRAYGIKVLSLFFIDRVDNYLPSNGLIRRLFEESFRELQIKYPEWSQTDVQSVHDGYFSTSTSANSTLDREDFSNDESAYHKIMVAKERLLSFDEPTAFIFSHSALREGWDNPNVFQICTLNATRSPGRKRQEIGRGVRLPVDINGNRIKDEQIAILTVIANESYESFVRAYQQEYEEDGVTEAPHVDNARTPKLLHPNAAVLADPTVKAALSTVAKELKYNLCIDSDALVKHVVTAALNFSQDPGGLVLERGRIRLLTDRSITGELSIRTHVAETKNNGSLPFDLVLSEIQNVLETNDPPIRLTRTTIGRAALAALRLGEGGGYATAVQIARALVSGLQEQIPNTIVYHDTGVTSVSDLFLERRFFGRTELGGNKSATSLVSIDSDVEAKFLTFLQNHDAVKFFFKLPSNYSIATPLGRYTPDWGIIAELPGESGSTARVTFLMRETKGTRSLRKLGGMENFKVRCGKRYFDELGVSFMLIDEPNQLFDATLSPWDP